jgi:hypothetical protein
MKTSLPRPPFGVGLIDCLLAACRSRLHTARGGGSRFFDPLTRTVVAAALYFSRYALCIE